MSFSLKLDRIAARADELRAILSEGLSGEASARASKELAEIEPVPVDVSELAKAGGGPKCCTLELRARREESR